MTRGLSCSTPGAAQAYDVSAGAAREEAAGLLRQPKALLPLCLAARRAGSRAVAQQLAFADVDLQARGASPTFGFCTSALAAWAFGACLCSADGPCLWLC